MQFTKTTINEYKATPPANAALGIEYFKSGGDQPGGGPPPYYRRSLPPSKQKILQNVLLNGFLHSSWFKQT